jgi:hypothetical protein
VNFGHLTRMLYKDGKDPRQILNIPAEPGQSATLGSLTKW